MDVDDTNPRSLGNRKQRRPTISQFTNGRPLALDAAFQNNANIKPQKRKKAK
jgi:hypothetical protein